MKDINKLSIADLMNAVATFNADPYCVEDDIVAQEVLDEIKNFGCRMITDREERSVALNKLDLTGESERIIYQAGGCLFSLDDDIYTYDVIFSDNEKSDCEGFHSDYKYCLEFIDMYNGTDHSYFADYKGGLVGIICNETEEVLCWMNVNTNYH